MAIIYSYPQGSSALQNDRVVITRIDEEENEITTKQLTIGQISDYTLARQKNDFLTGLTFNTGDGILTATVQNQSDVTVDLNGRYALASELTEESEIRSANDETLQDNIDAETLARTNADNTLQDNIDAEETARIAGDNALQQQINGVGGDLSNYQLRSEKGQADGYASLDSNGTVPVSQLPESVTGALEFQGVWDASTNTPTLPDPTTVKGHYYKVSVEGTYLGVLYHVGDWVLSDGVSWEHIHTQETVSDVFGREGSITAVESDYSAFYPLIQDLTDETNARVTGDAGLQNQIDAIPNPNDATITLTAGDGLTGGGDFTTDQAGNETITLSHAGGGITTTFPNITLNYGDTFKVGSINEVNGFDNFGHLRNIQQINFTLPDAPTLASLGYTGDTNANYITNNNQLINGAGYTTNVGDITGVTAGTNLTGGGTSGTVTLNLADTPTVTGINITGGDITLGGTGRIQGIDTVTDSTDAASKEYVDNTAITGITTSSGVEGGGLIGGVVNIGLSDDLRGNVWFIGRDTNDFYVVDTTSHRWYLDGNLDMLLENRNLHVGGDVIAYSTTTSDKRLKDNIKTIDNALEKVERLRGVEYDWNKGSRKGQHEIGVIAQEVEEVFPFLVHEHELMTGDFENDDTAYKTVDYEKLVGVLIESVKELSAKVNTLESKLQ